jgi:hypothetical protein
MSPKAFAALAVATAIAIGLAAHAVMTREVPAAGRTIDAPMFPGLLERLDEVATIRIESGGETLTLRRDGRLWRLDERSGYPVEAEKVRELARGIAALRLVEAKTRLAERLPRLELEDPGSADARSRRVTLALADGTPLAAAVLGKEMYNLYGGGRGGTYARRDGEDQAWLAAGEVRLPHGALGWLDTKILDIPTAEVARVTLAAGTPEAVVIAKPSRDAESFSLEPLAEGEQADLEKLTRVASAFSALSFADVRPAAEKPVPEDAPKARLETWDGLALTASVLREGEGDAAEFWVRLDAEAGPPAERVAEIDAKVEGWSFKLPRHLAERLLYGRADLLAKPAGTS